MTTDSDSRPLLVADFGTTAIKIARVDARGAIEALDRRNARFEEAGAASECDPETWWRALCAGVAAVIDDQPVAGIAITGLTRSQVFLDAGGLPTRPALTWRDARAAAIARELRGSGDVATEPGPSEPLTRLAWLRDAEPTVFARTRRVLELKDYLNYRLTGVVATDTVTLGRLDSPALGRDLKARMALLGLDRALLPEAIAPTAMVGRVCAGLEPPFDRLAGVPVFAASQDTWCATLGAGAVRDGGAYMVCGTTEASGVIVARPARGPGLITLPWGETLFCAGGPSQAGLDTLAWVGSLTGRDALSAIAAPAPRDEEWPLFFPYIRGERVPLWRDDIRGAFLGLNHRHGPDDLIAAAIDGIACAARQVIEASGVTPDEVRISGGGARGDHWCQVRADVLGVPVIRVANDEAGLTGAALTAAIGLGFHRDLAAAQAGIQIDRVFRPGATQARHDALYHRWRAAQAGVLAACAP